MASKYQEGDVESNPGPTTHTNKHTTVIWMCDLCHKQINKKQTSIRCNHTHNTHWVHLKCIHIQQRQYKQDWRCTFHTPTQNVTTTQLPITNKAQPTHSKTTINQRKKHRHNSNQHKWYQKQNRGTKTPSTRTQLDTITIQKTKLTQKAKHLKYPTTPPYAQTESTNKEGAAHHTDQGLHNFHKHEHT